MISCEPYLNHFLQIANKKLDIAAIVAPMVSTKKNIKVSLINGKTYNMRPYVLLKETLSDFYYDYIIVAILDGSLKNTVLEDLEKFKVNESCILCVSSIFTSESYMLRYMFNYVKKSIEKYKILVTGLSYAHDGIDAKIFSLPVLKCTMLSQDLYYDYLSAKRIFEMNNSSFKYSIIGISPYSFHYDESKSSVGLRGSGWSRGGGGWIWMYYLVFKDIHNFYLEKSKIEEIFDKDFLETPDDFVPENFNFDIYNNQGYSEKVIALSNLLEARTNAETWSKKRYPETAKENKKIFLNYLELCKKYSVVPIVTVFPALNIWREFFSKQLLDEFYLIISEAKKQYEFHFLDKWNFDDQLNVNDFIDAVHLNNSGAKKVSKYINDYIMQLEQDKI